MEHEGKKEAEAFMGDGFAPAETNEVGDWEDSGGSSLWDTAGQDAESGFEDWEGRQETHDMFHNSYD